MQSMQHPTGRPAALTLSQSVEAACLRARTLYALGVSVRSRIVLEAAMRKVYQVAEETSGGGLPFIDGIPHAGPVVQAARARAARMAAARQEFDLREAEEAAAREQFLARLPTAQALLERAQSAGTCFKFEDHKLWRVEANGLDPSPSGTEWVLTNPYGVDFCMRLRGVQDFERFLTRLRSFDSIGPTPHASDTQPPQHWIEDFTASDWCEPVDDAVARILDDAGPETFGIHAADPGCWLDFRTAVKTLFGEELV